jgi:hypothetical protein
MKGGVLSWQRVIRLVERGKESGTIKRGFFSKRTDFLMSGDATLAVQSFILWLALWRWKRPPSTGD